MTVERKPIPIKEGLFTWPSDKPHLIGTRCRSCGEVFFPPVPACANCLKRDVEEVALSTRGKLYSFTNVDAPPPDYKGEAPYGVGTIELPDGTVVLSLLTESDPKKFEIGMDMELVIERLYQDEEGSDVMVFKFKPVYGSGG